MNARRARPLLGTVVDIRIDRYPRDCDLHAAFSVAFAAAQKVHALMSAHEPSSDVSRINRSAPSERVTVHPWTYQVLIRACGIAHATGGLFDPCVAPLLQQAGYLPCFTVAGAGRGGDYRDIELLHGCAVRKRRPLQITLDGIAKGFAVDRAAAALKDAGAQGGVVNAGGDLRAFGPQAEPIHVRDPGDPARVALIGHLQDSALATSAAYFSRRYFDGRMTSHIFHPRAATTFLEPVSASVVAAECMIADALAKAVLLDAPATQAVLKRYGAKAIMMKSETRAL